MKKLLIGIGIGLVIGTATTATATTMGDDANLVATASAAPTARAPGGGLLFDKCPRVSALLRRPEVLEEALAALWRKLPVVFYNVTWAQGTHGAINHRTAEVSEAVRPAPGGSGDAGTFHRAAVLFCGADVARNSWAFRVGFGNTMGGKGGWIAFLSRATDGWHLYGAVPSYRFK